MLWTRRLQRKPVPASHGSYDTRLTCQGCYLDDIVGNTCAMMCGDLPYTAIDMYGELPYTVN